MDIKQIQELVKLINKSNIGELIIEENDLKVTIKQKKEFVKNVMMSPAIEAAPPSIQQSTTKLPPAKAELSEAYKEENYVPIKSPMIGTFYRQAGPGKSIFVNVGDEIEPGTVVCIIEAMKLFNEIESEVKGKIVKVLVEDASPVEFDQPLFLVDPS